MLNRDKFHTRGYRALELIKSTDDDWRPNLPGDKIKVRVSIRPSSTHQIFTVYICAIGASNYRFELSYDTENKKLAEKKYDDWFEFVQSLPDVVNKSLFKEIGLQEKES